MPVHVLITERKGDPQGGPYNETVRADFQFPDVGHGFTRAVELGSLPGVSYDVRLNASPFGDDNSLVSARDAEVESLRELLASAWARELALQERIKLLEDRG